MPSNSERPKLPSLDRLRELLNEVNDSMRTEGEAEIHSVLEWVINELEARSFRYRKQWMKQKLLAQVGKERLDRSELEEIDRQAAELALKLTEEVEDGRASTEGDPEATEADQGDSGEEATLNADAEADRT